jgi:hypothetical protein
MTTMCFSALPVSAKTLFIVSHTAEVPGGEEWAAFMRAITDHRRQHDGDLDATRVLFMSDGGMADTGMRLEFFRAIEKPIPIAVVVEDAAARSQVTAMRWADPNARAFAPGDAEKVLQHLGIPPRDARSLVLPALRMLRAQHPDGGEMMLSLATALAKEADRSQAR